MQLRSDVPYPGSMPEERGAWGAMTSIFREAKPGDSVHFSDEKQAASFKASFHIFKRNNVVGMKISKRKVGQNDPDGPGYRIFFIKNEHEEPEHDSVWG